MWHGSLAILTLLVTICQASVAQGVDRVPVQRDLILHVFIRSDSDKCLVAADYARQLAAQRPGLRVEVHDLLNDAAIRAKYRELAGRFGVKQPTLPAFYVFDRLKLGFQDAAASGPHLEELLKVHAYVRAGCPHCAAGKRFLNQIKQEYPALVVSYHELGQDPSAQSQMNAAARWHHKQVTGLPVIEICGQLIVGYDSDATTGRQIEKLLQRAAQPLVFERAPAASSETPGSSASAPRTRISSFALAGYRTTVQSMLPSAEEPPAELDPFELPPVDSDATGPDAERPLVPVEEQIERKGIEIPGLGYLSVEEWGLPAFTVLIGLIDGFNPCAMWVLVLLLSVLVNVKSRTRMLAIAGSFVLVSGFAYFAFMAAWLNLFDLIGLARPLQLVLGCLAILIGLVNVKDFFAFHRGVTLSIPESVKPAIYARVAQVVRARYLSAAIAAAVVLALMVNVVELLCTAGLPALYADILNRQDLSTAARYGYLALYNLAYIFDDSLMVGVVVITLSRKRVQEREGRWLKLIGGVVMLGLGAVMIARPDWLQFAASS